jgi:hypothetical protein
MAKRASSIEVLIVDDHLSDQLALRPMVGSEENISVVRGNGFTLSTLEPMCGNRVENKL